MRYLDVSLPITPGMPVYPGDPPVELAPWLRRTAGNGFNVSSLRLGTHTGTHVDAPAHCIDDGAAVDTLPLDILCGPAFVLDLAGAPGVRTALQIGPGALAAMPAGCRRLLLRTHDGTAWTRPLPDVEPALTEAAAVWLLQRGVRLCGIDRLSIAAASDPLPVHAVLLGAGAVILEGLDLGAAPAGPCTLLCLPLRVAGGDGAPARVVLAYD